MAAASRATLQQALVQGLLSRRMVKRAELEHLYAELCSALGLRSALDEDLAEIQPRVAAVGLDVRTCHDPINATPYIVLMNAKADTLAEVATPYSPSELQYIKALIDAIFHAPDHRFSVPSTQALQLASNMQPPMTKHAANELLHSLEHRGWLVLSRRTGAYSLSLRALMELDTYLRNDMEECVLESRPTAMARFIRHAKARTVLGTRIAGNAPSHGTHGR
ncbi:hypothetical protein MNAN1_003074 [Malassezia nana]|uniref:Non-structural maintenance of chromosomes element 1 homolog n=1 Tax=Malassezia nana TaxID=180528 RepID=A0AAF0ESK4_9BASI|nr:hypothetical protein MNAN1_003074 [Malassezia nana]